RVETQLWNRETDILHDRSFYEGDPAYDVGVCYLNLEEQIARLQRRLSSLERSFHRALADLQKLQAKRPPAPQPVESTSPSPQIGFVPPLSSDSPDPKPPAPARRLKPGFPTPTAPRPAARFTR